MSVEDFTSRAAYIWRKESVPTRPFPAWFALWCYENVPREQSTWDKILKAFRVLCMQNNDELSIRVHQCKDLSLVHHFTQGQWKYLINRQGDEDFLEQLTAMAKPPEVTFAEAKAAAYHIASTVQGDSADTLNRYFNQKEEARP